MFFSAVVSFIAGMILGARFRVGILVPAIVIVLVAIFALGRLSGQGLALMVGSGILALIALQLGYLSGAVGAVRPPLKLGQPDRLSARDWP